MRAPDFVIGDPADPYLRRWWIIPRNKWFNIYLHHIRKPDDDRALHDHPWWNMSILLRGGYFEMTPSGGRLRFAPGIVIRRPTAAHRLIPWRGDVWTLFVTGPRVREWGFHCPKGWVVWTKFVDPTGIGRAGPGCGD